MEPTRWDPDEWIWADSLRAWRAILELSVENETPRPPREHARRVVRLPRWLPGRAYRRGGVMDLLGLTHYTNPFNRSDWHGRFVSLDDTPASDFTEDDVAEVVACGDSGDEWDGEVAAVLRLKDGRFVSYETFYGPTGSGFSEDAYGGDADLKFGATLEVVQRLGLTDNGRRLCGWEPDQFDGGEHGVE